MKKLCLLFLLPVFQLAAQIPQLIHYQGRIAVNGVNFTGQGHFKFALVSQNGNTTYWSHDGTSVLGGAPDGFLKIDVVNGLYQVLLGDVQEMNLLPASVFQNGDVHLRVWFSDQVLGFQQLAPDQRIAAVGYAMMAATAQQAQSVAAGAVTSAALAPNAVQSVHLQEGSVGSLAIASNSIDTVHLRPGSVRTATIDFEAVTADRIAEGAVGTAQLAAGAVTTPILANQSVTGEKLADSAVGFQQLAPGAVSGDRIADGAVQANHLAEGLFQQHLAGEGQSGVPSGGLILSETENYNLLQAGFVRVGTVDVDGSWRRVDGGSAPAARQDHTAVWTGQVWIVWGGVTPAGRTNTGGIFNPANNLWTPLNQADAPAARSAHSAVWTGTEMIIWGGTLVDGTPTNSGARYSPATDTWTALPAGGPTARRGHTAVWTGDRMIIWGGTNGTEVLNTGSRYNPATNTWSGTAVTGAPTVRRDHTAVWTGSEMIVWGGRNQAGDLKHLTGGRYNPETNTWTATATFFAPSARTGHTAVWTGTEMWVWGGNNQANVNIPTGGRYSPATNAWSDLQELGVPEARSGHTAVWGAGKMWLWGGAGETPFYETGYSFDPATNSWAPMPSAEHAASGHTAVWTGTEMLVYGGAPFQTRVQRFRPDTGDWQVHDPGAAPVYRPDHQSVWIGGRMFIWGGGYSNSGGDLIYPTTGALFDPASGSWSPVSTVNAPMGRQDFSMIWTGTHVIIWGGRRYLPDVDVYDYLQTGAIYDPQLDTWTPITTLFAPAARSGHSTIWTGTEMIVWGGRISSLTSAVNTGGRYNPASNTWTSTSVPGAPAPRRDHLSLWNGEKMMVYGGRDSNGNFGNGGLYDPISDEWVAMPPTILTPDAVLPSLVSGPSGWHFLHSSAAGGSTLHTLQTPTRWSVDLNAIQLHFDGGFHPHAVSFPADRHIAFGRSYSSGPRGDALGLEVETGGRSIRPVPSIPGVIPGQSHGPGVFSGTEALKFVGTNAVEGPGRIYGYTPSRTLYLYQRP